MIKVLPFGLKGVYETGVLAPKGLPKMRGVAKDVRALIDMSRHTGSILTLLCAGPDVTE